MARLGTMLIYDQETANRIAGGNPAIAAELLELFIQDLMSQTDTLEQAYAATRWEELRQLAHKLRGSASYCATPALLAAAEKLETVITDTELDLIGECYRQLRIEITRLLQHYAALENHHRDSSCPT